MYMLVSILVTTALFAQKKVDASVDLVSKSRDSINLGKGKTVVVMLPVKNRAGDDWRLSRGRQNLNLHQAIWVRQACFPISRNPNCFSSRQ